MKDFASFLMIGALCVAACASEPPASNTGTGNVQTVAGSAAPSGAAAGGSAQPPATSATAGTKATTGVGGAGSAPVTTATAGSGTTPAAGGTAGSAPSMTAAAGSSGTSVNDGSMSTTTAPMGSFKAAYELALRDMCMGCHTPGALIGSPNLSAIDKAYDSLVDKDATTMVPGQCMGMGKLVTPGNCETSLLYNKIAEDMPKCGRHMPLGSDTMPTRLPPAAVEAVCAWIKAGAKKD